MKTTNQFIESQQEWLKEEIQLSEQDGTLFTDQFIKKVANQIVKNTGEKLMRRAEEGLPKKKPVIVNMLQEDSLFIRHGIDGVIGYNEALKEAKTTIKKHITNVTGVE